MIYDKPFNVYKRLSTALIAGCTRSDSHVSRDSPLNFEASFDGKMRSDREVLGVRNMTDKTDVTDHFSWHTVECAELPLVHLILIQGKLLPRS